MGSLFIPNRSRATGTWTRLGDEVLPQSGMCVTCLDGCPGFCEIGKSSYRGPEAIYPGPFGQVTASAQKEFPVDFSHFNITGSITGHHQKEYDLFTNANIGTCMGRDRGLKLRIPIICTGLGSTMIAQNHFESLGIGAAISGSGIVIGENVAAMDDKSTVTGGKVADSPELVRRFKSFKGYQKDGYGFIAIQANQEDWRLGVLPYCLEKLGSDAVELKWGQGAKNIGGEVKLTSIEKAIRLKKLGYVVIPDPEDKVTQHAFETGTIKGFERHTRMCAIPDALSRAIDGFMNDVQHLRDAGAKYVFLKTGSYRPSDLARAIKFASLARIDVLTIDGSGGGTGMSPWRMMNEWGVPTVYIAALTYQYCKRLADRGEYVPDIVLAGGLVSEDHIYKSFALLHPFIKAVGMSRSTICAAMVGNTIGKAVAEGKVPKPVSEYGATLDQIFYFSGNIKEQFGNIPAGAMGMYSYYQRLATGLRQIMAGSRRWSVTDITRDDIFSLTREAADVTGISYIMDYDKEQAEKVLDA
ncbi:MAG: glutamate synthase [Planctomycetes bacterium RIFOXYD2_FULL_41_16]|nr:MAG: glutamate synthase [Planctomycetes bacterium RIFOXYD2_FULL_41_16]